MKKIILSDDFTGSMEIGGILWKSRIDCIVGFDTKFISEKSVSIIDTKTRNLTLNKVKKTYDYLLKNLNFQDVEIIYKKIDSTFRGNIQTELESILENKLFDVVFICPTNIEANRTVINGILLVDGIPVDKTDIGKDPFSPVNNSNIAKLLAKLNTSNIFLKDFNKGQNHIIKTIKKRVKGGNNVFIFDSKDENNISDILEIERKIDLKILLCGSAGLFNKYYDTKEMFRKCKIQKNNSPLVVISGSPAIKTKKQIEVAKNSGFKVFSLFNKTEINEINITDIIDYIENNNDIIIDFAGESKTSIYNENIDKEHLYKTSEFINMKVKEIVDIILEKTNICGLLFCGGDTCSDYLIKSGINKIKIEGLVEEYVPMGSFEKLNKKIIFASKAGGFGSDKIIERVSKIIKGVK